MSFELILEALKVFEYIIGHKYHKKKTISFRFWVFCFGHKLFNLKTILSLAGQQTATCRILEHWNFLHDYDLFFACNNHISLKQSLNHWDTYQLSPLEKLEQPWDPALFLCDHIPVGNSHLAKFTSELPMIATGN